MVRWHYQEREFRKYPSKIFFPPRKMTGAPLTLKKRKKKVHISLLFTYSDGLIGERDRESNYYHFLGVPAVPKAMVNRE